MPARTLLFAVIAAVLCLCSPAWGQEQSTTVYTFQESAAPHSTRSITFISAGYASAETFLSDVRLCIGSLLNNTGGSTGGVNADPWPRYASLLNLYAVFQPDNARRMDCNTAFANPHFLSCDQGATRSLLSVSPARDIAVVLSNNDTIAGSGANGIAYITNNKKYMAYALLHHLNGAVAGLREEYNMGVTEDRDAARYQGDNCAASATDAKSKWGHWHTTVLPGEKPVAMETTTNGCTFSNFIAPTKGQCVMANSSAAHMCPVCRERLVTSLFTTPTTADAAPLNLVAARCPPAGYTLHVDADRGEGVFLSVGKFAYQNDVSVAWFLPDGTEILRGSHVFVLRDLFYLPLPTVITAVVTDNTPYVRDTWRSDAQQVTTLFNIQRRTDASVCIDSTADPAAQCTESSLLALKLEPEQFATCLTKSASAEAAGTAAAADADAISRSATPFADDPVTNANSSNTFTKDPNAKEPTFKKRDVIIVAAVVGGICVIILIVTYAVYFGFYRRHPHEVLNVYWLDQVIYIGLPVLCTLSLLISSIILIFVVVYIPEQFFFGKAIFVAALVLGSIVFVCAAVNLCCALFHQYVVSLICGVFFFILAVGFFAVGAFSIWARMNTTSSVYVNTLEKLWDSTIEGSTGRTYICDLQEDMKCSGFKASCAVIGNSSSCPTDCDSNVYTNPCVFQVGKFIEKKYTPIGTVCLIGSLFFLLTGFVDMLYFMRFRQLSRTGKLRRTFRRDPQPPVIPITYKETQKAREMFATITDSSNTLQGSSAVSFLEAVFDEKLSTDYATAIEKCGPLTFDQLMSIHFPYMLSTATDPRMLTADEAEPCADMIELEKKQMAKLDAFMKASGALSPETLQRVFQSYAHERFLPQKKEVLALIEKAATRCPDTELLRGLRPDEVEALRGVWVALHPKIEGTLTDAEIDRFYQWSHGVPLEDAEAFKEWKKQLDVRGRGVIGWGEFCYPYAQRALLQRARNVLAEKDKEVPPEMVSREAVASRFDEAVVDAVFLQYEKAIPIERLIAYILERPRSINVTKKE